MEIANGADVAVGSGSEPLRIALVSDFFFPNMGGVEMHIYHLGNCLIRRGHKVIVVTHSYGDRKGVRYLSNGIKVYYAPQKDFYNQSSLPTVYFSGFHALLRNILIRERIQVLHGHGAFSTMALEGICTTRTLGLRTVFTDHSLFGFADASSIHTNKLLKFVLMDADHVICVSHTSKENTVLRAALDPADVSVIPNAIDVTKFVPDPSKRDPSKITIVIISRLTYRKGVDLMIEVIPEVCAANPDVQFIVGGNGPMMTNLEEMRERHQLHERVRLLGGVSHSEVRNVLVQGDIFINFSLTEAFCMAVLEAVSCGLLAVSTKVGGVPEILPDHLIKLAEPVAEDLVAKTKLAISELRKFDPWRAHEQVRQMYSWYDVAVRTEKVYKQILKTDPPTLIDRMRRFYVVGGPWAGKIWAMMMAFGVLVAMFWAFLWPTSEIDIAPDFPYKSWPNSTPLPDEYFSTSTWSLASSKNLAPSPSGRRGSAPAQTQAHTHTHLMSLSMQQQPILQDAHKLEIFHEDDDEQLSDDIMESSSSQSSQSSSLLNSISASSSPSSSPSSEVKRVLRLTAESPRTPYGDRAGSSATRRRPPKSGTAATPNSK